MRFDLIWRSSCNVGALMKLRYREAMVTCVSLSWRGVSFGYEHCPVAYLDPV